VEVEQFLVRHAGRQLGYPYEGGAEPPEGIEQVSLVKCLERAGYDGSAGESVIPHALPIVVAGEGIRQVAVVGDQWETAVDNVKVGVEDFDIVEWWHSASPLDCENLKSGWFVGRTFHIV